MSCLTRLPRGSDGVGFVPSWFEPVQITALPNLARILPRYAGPSRLVPPTLLSFVPGPRRRSRRSRRRPWRRSANRSARPCPMPCRWSRCCPGHPLRSCCRRCGTARRTARIALNGRCRAEALHVPVVGVDVRRAWPCRSDAVRKINLNSGLPTPKDRRGSIGQFARHLHNLLGQG